MKKKSSKQNKTIKLSTFHVTAIVFCLIAIVSLIIISQYQPSPSTPPSTITFEQKIAHLETGTPLPQENVKVELPRWMVVMVCLFILIQLIPLLLASYKTKMGLDKLTPRDLRQIEFLVETPLFLGLLGSLLGVCLTQFINGSLAAPLAYLTTISGIILFIIGRFTISVSLPPTTHELV